LVAGGAFMVIKTEGFYDFFGGMDWADKYLGSSRFAYKLIGILACIIGFLVITDLWSAFLGATLGQLLPGAKK